TVSLEENEDYRIVTETERGFIEPVAGKSWPAFTRLDYSIKFIFRAGYGDTYSDIPKRIRDWIYLQVGEAFANRETSIVGTSYTEIEHIKNMLDQFRV